MRKIYITLLLYCISLLATINSSAQVVISQLYGGGGNDVIDGGTDNDILFGVDDLSSIETGVNILLGGDGQDRAPTAFTARMATIP